MAARAASGSSPWRVRDAKDKVMMGTERKSIVMTPDEKRMTAYHEAGHAIVAMHEPASDPIHKATIIPRGRALGMVDAPAGARQLLLSPRQDVRRSRRRRWAAASPRS
jgi:ATP-dependent Zn protease